MNTIKSYLSRAQDDDFAFMFPSSFCSFVWYNCLRKFPFYSVSVRFDLRSQSKAVDTNLLLTLSLLVDKFQNTPRTYARKKTNLTVDMMFL